MKKIAYIQLFDHQDPLWNKAFEDHFVDPLDPAGVIVRPYSEREEMQFDRWIDILPGTKGILMIEIAATLRKYLELNPHRLEQLRRLNAAGQLDFMASGTTVLDYNLVHGESIYRNFLYGQRWVERTFDVTPSVAGANDTFGLSAQLPQILRQFGLRWLASYSRAFGRDVVGMETEWVSGKPVKPYWRGLDGTLLCIQRHFPEHSRPCERIFVNYQYKHCPACRGQGCRFCEYTGLDRHIEYGAESAAPFFQALLDSDQPAGHYQLHSEETARTPSFMRDLESLAERMGIELRYVSTAWMQEHWVGERVAALEAGAVADDQVDAFRREANPIATGCYISRSILKRCNRELEHLLLAAEKFCALAGQRYAYPAETFERLWTIMSLTQAHDALTANHPDGPFQEMLTYYRKVRKSAGKHLLGACRALAAEIDLAPPAGMAGVAVFNPLNWTVDGAATEIMIPAAELPGVNPAAVVGWTLRSADGAAQQLIRWETVTITDKVFFRLHCRCSGLPSVGYATIYCEPLLDEASENASVKRISDGATSADVEAAGLQARVAACIVGPAETDALHRVEGGCIENDWHRIEFDDSGLRAIVDKRLGRRVAGPGSLDLLAEDDCGSLWERLKYFGIRKNLSELGEVSCRAWSGAFAKLEIRGRLSGPLSWELPAAWSQELQMSRGAKIRDLSSDEVEVLIRHCRWTHELYLFPDSPRVEIRTTIDCDSENIRLLTGLDFGFATPDDRAWYEIPCGMIDRPSYAPKDGTHLCPDGVWPALHWAAAVNAAEGYTCGVLNRGIPAHRFEKGMMELHLLRSGRLSVWGPRSIEQSRATSPLAKDTGRQVYEYALVSGPGDVAAYRMTHQGYEFNSVFPAVLAGGRGVCGGERAEKRAASASLLANVADNVVIAAVKRAEDDDSIILRMTEVYGQAAEDRLDGGLPISEVSPMEREDKPLPDGRASLRPFEVKTIRVRLQG